MKDLPQTYVTIRTRRYVVREKIIQKLGLTICSHLGVEQFDLAIQFVGDGTMRRLNREFRGKDKTTDVLSFPQLEWAKPALCKPRSAVRHTSSTARAQSRRSAALPCEPLGDLVISLPVAARNARMIGQGLDREICFLLVHGILHLCGHDHMKPAEEKLMLREQRRLMTLLGEGDAKTALWRGCVTTAPRSNRKKDNPLVSTTRPLKGAGL